MNQLRPTSAIWHASPATFIRKILQDSMHVFLWQDTILCALEPPYSGPHKVIARTDKTLKIVVRGRQITVSAESSTLTCWKKINMTQTTHQTNPAKPDATPTLLPRTTHSGHTVRLPVRFST